MTSRWRIDAESTPARPDVSVAHALAVGMVKRLGHIGRDVDSVTDRKLMLAVRPVLQGVTFHVGHHVESLGTGEKS